MSASFSKGGPRGATGQSAYEAAVTDGFVGTEEAWLASLKGDPGDTGAQGPQGNPGATGATGQGVPTGGGTGQVLAKSSNTDFATTWATPSSLAIGAMQDVTTTRTALETSSVGIALDATFPVMASVNYRINVPDGNSWCRIYLVMSVDDGATWQDADNQELRRNSGGGIGSFVSEITLNVLLPPGGKIFTFVDASGAGSVEALNWVRKQRLA